MLYSSCCAPVTARRPHAVVRPCCPVSVRKCSTARPRVDRCHTVTVQNFRDSSCLCGSGVSELAKKTLLQEPFVACNCYYLLPYACEDKGDHTFANVEETLKLIQDTGFNVVRIWAFSNGPGDECLQKAPGKLPDLAPLDKVVDAVRARNAANPGKPLKLMMTLSNGAPGYGGYWQYVRWARKDPVLTKPGPFETDEKEFADLERYEFWSNWDPNNLTDDTTVGGRARGFYETYIKHVVEHYKDNDVIHSWDLCNEPRNELPGRTNNEIGDWVRKMAAVVKSIDHKHPVTVGSEGFFGPATPGMPDLMASNPFPPAGNTWNEGCNWLYEGACTDIDFVSIHTWADQWTKREQVPAGFNSPEQFWEWANEQWVLKHIEAARQYLGNKPLVLQEYNMPACDERKMFYSFVQEQYLADNPLLGVMVWMIAHEGYAQDRYTLYRSCRDEMAKLHDMCGCRTCR